MAFTPKTLDGLAAGAAFMKLSGVRRGTCLNTVWRAFGSPKSDGLNNGYPWASDALMGARDAGALRRGSIADAPPGAILYWSNVKGTWNRNGKKVYGDAGHIGIKGHGGFWTIDATGGGSLDFVANDRLAKKWSWVKFEGYAYGPGAFLGHTVTAVTAASGAASPLDNTPPPPPLEDNDMIVIRNSSGHHFAVDTEFIHWLGSDAHVALLAGTSSIKDEVHHVSNDDLRVVLEGRGIPDQFHDPAVLAAYGAGDKWSRQIDNARKLDTLLGVEVKIDTVDLSSTIAKAVAAQINVQGVKVDAKAIATAVEAALLDNFAGIPKAVNDDEAARMVK